MRKPEAVLVGGDVVLDRLAETECILYGGAGRVARVAARLAPTTLVWPYRWDEMRLDQVGCRLCRPAGSGRGQHLPVGLGLGPQYRAYLGSPAWRTYSAAGAVVERGDASAPVRPRIATGIDPLLRMRMPVGGIRCLVDHGEPGDVCKTMLSRPDGDYMYTVLSTRRPEQYPDFLVQPGRILQWAAPPGSDAIPLCRIADGSGLLVTRGHVGADLYWGAEEPQRLLPLCGGDATLAATGAGDIVTGVLAGMLARGKSPAVAAQVAVYAASRAVTATGTDASSPLHVDRVRPPSQRALRYWTALAHATTATPDHVLDAAQQGVAHVVYIPGCFDRLHSGHARLLAAAVAQRCGFGMRCVNRALFVLAVPDDESIAAVKGPLRPYESFAVRAQAAVTKLLAAPGWCRSDIVRVLRYGYGTDATWLGRFGRKVDLLVKGSDYADRDIPGSEFAKRVHIVPRLPGVSTTELVAHGNGL